MTKETVRAAARDIMYIKGHINKTTWIAEAEAIIQRCVDEQLQPIESLEIGVPVFAYSNQMPFCGHVATHDFDVEKKVIINTKYGRWCLPKDGKVFVLPHSAPKQENRGCQEKS